jgi:hypothetical protein
MPALSEDEYAALKADIAERGIVVPVVEDQHGNVLDGHHRVRIAAELGIGYPTELRNVADDDEARRVAFALNLARRHLTREQRRQLIAREITADPGRSDREIGRLLGVDHKTVGSVRRELRGEVPHPEIPTEAIIARRIADLVEDGYKHAEGDARREWAAAVQAADLVLDWADSPLPSRFFFTEVAGILYAHVARLEAWAPLAPWLVVVARHTLAECDGLRDPHDGGGRLPGEDLAQVTLALWGSDVDDEMRQVLFRALSDRIAIALGNAEPSLAGASV